MSQHTRPPLFNIDHVYVIHFTDNIDRKSYLDQWFESHHFSKDYMTYVTYTRGDQLSDAMIRQHYDPSPEISIFKGQATSSSFASTRKLTKNEISLAINHIHLLRQSLEQNYQRILVLEDDIIFNDGFVTSFNQVMTSCPLDADIISLDDGFSLHIDRWDVTIDAAQNFYLHPQHFMRCSASYVITQSAIQRLLTTLVPFSLPIDWEYNYQFTLHNFNVYWLEPTICSQGSQKGIYENNLTRDNG